METKKVCVCKRMKNYNYKCVRQYKQKQSGMTEITSVFIFSISAGWLDLLYLPWLTSKIGVQLSFKKTQANKLKHPIRHPINKNNLSLIFACDVLKNVGQKINITVT